MKLPRFEYAEPRSSQEACRLLESLGGEGSPIAGGTDIIMGLKNRQRSPRVLVDLSKIPALNQISYSDQDGLKIGAMVSLRHLAADHFVRTKYPIIAQAALSVGSVQLQAMGTVGGNLCQDTCCMYFNRPEPLRQSLEPCHKLGGDVCHVVNCSEDCWATYAGDLAPALLVLGAEVKIASAAGEKIIPLRKLFSAEGKRPQTLQPGEIVTEIRVPRPAPRSGGAYLKLRQRETLDYALLGLAVNLTVAGGEGNCDDIAVALTAVDQGPVLVEEAKSLKGQKLTKESITQLARAARERAHPIKSLYGTTVPYRREMVSFYVESAIREALKNATN